MAQAIYNNANCMGYAFGKNKWMIPHGWNIDGMEEAVQFILNHFGSRVKFYKQYSKTQGQQMIQQLPLGKTFVVLREEDKFGEDFHFVKRLPSGHWRHKRGSHSIEPVTAKWVAQKRWPMLGSLAYGNDYLVFEMQQ